MTSILLMLLLSIIGAQRLSHHPSCPASCVVCSEDAVICHRLSHIIDAPDSTQALLLTEGFISTVQPSSLSDLSNITLIGLSHNRISVLGEQSFRNLSLLHTLLLDHNLLTSQTLQGGALSHLAHLEVLALGNNQISMIQAEWFEGTKALRSLKLERNLLTSLDSGSLPLNDLRHLETLDLSDNLIGHLNRDSFRGLVGLRTLDLSRNRLSSAPAEAFSYLSWLTSLNLDLNSWNCSCQLLELSTFLANFIQQPDKVLYNGRRMVCVSADNPAVTTVLELTEANCAPSNHNITLRIVSANSVTPQRYARDVAITAVVCFIGGLGLTLLVVYQVSRRKKLRERNGQKVEGESTVANHNVIHQDGSGKRRDLPLPAHSSQPWDREAALLDPRIETHGDHVRSRAGEGGRHFRCPACSGEGQRGAGLNPTRQDNRMNGGTEADEEREKRRLRMMMEEERRRPGTRRQGIMTRDAAVTGHKLLSHGSSNYYSAAQREAVGGQRPESLSAYKTSREMNNYRTDKTSREMDNYRTDKTSREMDNYRTDKTSIEIDNYRTDKTSREMDNYRTDMDHKSRAGNEILRCESCHKTFEHRPAEQAYRQGRFHTSMRDSAPFDGYHSQYRLSTSGRDVSYNQFDLERNGGLRREMRNVTFHLESPDILKGGNGLKDDRGEEARTSRDKQRRREGGSGKHKANVLSGRVLKVKLNLNPLRKSKVHPKKKTEQGHTEKSGSKKEKRVKRSQGKVGKGRGEKEARRSSSQKKKESGKKMKKSTGTKGLTEVDEKEEEDEEGGEGGQQSRTSSEQKKLTSETQQGSSEGDQQNNTQPENSQHMPDNAADTTAQSDATGAEGASAIGQQVGPPSNGQGQITQGSGVQSHGTSLLLQNGQLSSQPPFSLSAADRNRTTNLSLLGTAGSQLAGSSLSLQGGNLFSHMAPTANAMFPSKSANAIAPNIAYGGLSTHAASSGNPESQSFGRQAGLGLGSPATSLLANSIPTNPLLGIPIHTSPIHASQPGGLTSNLAANPTINPAPVQSLSQSQPPPAAMSLAARLRSDPAQGPGPQTGEGQHRLAPPPPALPAKDILPLPTQAQGPIGGDGLSLLAPRAPGPVTEENLLNNSLTQTGGSVVNVSIANLSAGGVATADGAAGGVSGGNMHVADVPVSCVSAVSMSAANMSIQNLSAGVGSSTGSLSAAATLLQQEYLSEDGGSSPKRKLRLVLPEKTSGRPPTALEKKIR